VQVIRTGWAKMNEMKYIPIANYFSDNPKKAVYRISGVPDFSPLAGYWGRSQHLNFGLLLGNY